MQEGILNCGVMPELPIDQKVMMSLFLPEIVN